MSKAQSNVENEEDFVFMGNTRAYLTEVWDHWQKNLGHTPEVARRMMDAAMKEFHQSELYPHKKKVIQKTKSKMKQVTKAVRTSAKAVKRKTKR